MKTIMVTRAFDKQWNFFFKHARTLELDHKKILNTLNPLYLYICIYIEREREKLKHLDLRQFYN